MVGVVDDEAIRSVVTRLARSHASGGEVIERAAILAEGGDFPAVMAWITAHGGLPEELVAAPPRRGLHGSRMDQNETNRTPRRFVLPPGALSADQ
jgi:hypothetical protein